MLTACDAHTYRTDPHGLNSTGDVEFDLSFRWVYNHIALDVPWYAVLGNHDYGDGATEADDEACLAADGGCTRSPLHQVRYRNMHSWYAHAIAQLDAGLFARDRRWNCARLYSMVLGGGTAELFFMDTSPFVLKYQHRPWARFHGGHGASSLCTLHILTQAAF